MRITINESLSKISDPRCTSKVSHSLSSLLKLVLLSKLCRRLTLISAWRLGMRLSDLERQRIGFIQGAPYYSTITGTLKSLDADEVRLVLATAVRSFGMEADEAIAVDGKALCGSADDEAPAVKLLSAFCVRLQGVIGEVPVADGHNEITAMLDLLDKVDVSGMILTGDAIFAQKAICDKIVEKKADFVFTVKDNQKALKETIKAATSVAGASLSPSRNHRHRRREPV